MSIKTQTFALVAGNVPIVLPARPQPWRLLSLSCTVITSIGPLSSRLLKVAYRRGKVCTIAEIPSVSALADGQTSIQSFALFLPHVSVGVAATNWQTAPLLEAWLMPDDQVTLELEEGDANDTIDGCTAVIEDDEPTRGPRAARD